MQEIDELIAAVGIKFTRGKKFEWIVEETSTHKKVKSGRKFDNFLNIILVGFRTMTECKNSDFPNH